MRRALLIGIDDYPSAPLAGCINDAEALSDLLATHADGSPNFETRVMRSDTEQITRASLRQAITALFADPADVALLYFSGHGTENDLGGYLVTPDAARYDEGVPLSDVLTMANRCTDIREIAIILDSCHSGALGTVPPTTNDQVHIREGISILTASRASQPAYEADGRGLFSTLVCSALDGGAADVRGHVTVAAVYAYVDQSFGAWDQRPLFKAHVSRMLSLRTGEPLVPLDVLRRLPEWFPAADHDFALSPAHEWTQEPRDDEAEAIFKCLQKCANAKLVVPIDHEAMYWAAIHSTGCRLTSLGQFYWQLANAGRL